MIKFDLERALAGDELIDRDGDDVAGFRCINASRSAQYPYGDDCDNTYTSSGLYMSTPLSETGFDLFMKHEVEPERPNTDTAQILKAINSQITALQEQIKLLEGKI